MFAPSLAHADSAAAYCLNQELLRGVNSFSRRYLLLPRIVTLLVARHDIRTPALRACTYGYCALLELWELDELTAWRQHLPLVRARVPERSSNTDGVHKPREP